jgi:hypothetical protein
LSLSSLNHENGSHSGWLPIRPAPALNPWRHDVSCHRLPPELGGWGAASARTALTPSTIPTTGVPTLSNLSPLLWYGRGASSQPWPTPPSNSRSVPRQTHHLRRHLARSRNRPLPCPPPTPRLGRRPLDRVRAHLPRISRRPHLGLLGPARPRGAGATRASVGYILGKFGI